MAEGDEPANENHGNFYLWLDLRAEVDLASFLCRSEIGSLAADFNNLVLAPAADPGR
jgi:hypothetical protein